MTNILVVEAHCPGDADGRLCNGDLTHLVQAACKNQPMPHVTVKCPNCHSRIRVRLPWQETLVAHKPPAVAERVP